MIATLRKLGGEAAAAKSKYSFPVDKLKSQADVLRQVLGETPVPAAFMS